MTMTEQKQAQRQAGVAARKALSAQVRAVQRMQPLRRSTSRRKRTAAQGALLGMQPGAGKWNPLRLSSKPPNRTARPWPGRSAAKDIVLQRWCPARRAGRPDVTASRHRCWTAHETGARTSWIWW